MIVICKDCDARYDDQYRTTICPHDTFAANDGQNHFAHHPESELRTQRRCLLKAGHADNHQFGDHGSGWPDAERCIVRYGDPDAPQPPVTGLEPVAAPTKPPIPDAQAMRRVGALAVQSERVQAVQDQLVSQRAIYENYGKADLIDALLRRDEQAMLEGRQLADGRIAGRMLREFVRSILGTADAAALRQVEVGAKGGQIERILQALGAEPADLRQLKLAGHTLGRDEAEVQQRAEDLASGKLKE